MATVGRNLAFVISRKSSGANHIFGGSSCLDDLDGVAPDADIRSEEPVLCFSELAL